MEADPYFAALRASHILEEPFLWGSDVFGFGYVFTPAELVLSQRMTDYWTNFAKTGDPNGPGLPQWPQFDATTQAALTFDDQIGVVTNYHSQQCSVLDTVPEPFPEPPSQNVARASLPWSTS
jgi:para-nitrobenzyl esterase